ncbi:MAG TPA: diguanylate cyclase [Pseudolabrys sp.]|nr:diguanylate cyclase [Pseudolabrys sp.]
MARLAATIEAQARTIGRYQTALARSRDTFERAAAAARLGLWECDLTTETLQWSPGTYDMFDIPREQPLRRRQTLIRYPDESLKTLESVRSRAIAERSGFDLDTAIVTPSGGKRWIRITATVDCAGSRPVRLFGLKQDITAETERWQRAHYFAEFDELTGLANRRQLKARLAAACDQQDGAGGALLLLDLDGFKNVNDAVGHAVGDECLKEAARRLLRACDAGDLVARLGGDEFAVVLPAGPDSHATLLARKIIATMTPPIQSGAHCVRVGVSIGIASLAGCLPHEALKRADLAMYAAKAAGRNTFRRFCPTRMRV